MPTIAPRRELFAWAMYDFANSGYTTVVLTTIFNAYFVGVVVGRAAGFPEGVGTLLWTLAVSIPNRCLVSAPVLGAIADHYPLKSVSCSSPPSVVSWALPYWDSPDQGMCGWR